MCNKERRLKRDRQCFHKIKRRQRQCFYKETAPQQETTQKETGEGERYLKGDKESSVVRKETA